MVECQPLEEVSDDQKTGLKPVMVVRLGGSMRKRLGDTRISLRARPFTTKSKQVAA
jgi:hypothetical protein